MADYGSFWDLAVRTLPPLTRATWLRERCETCCAEPTVSPGASCPAPVQRCVLLLLRLQLTHALCGAAPLLRVPWIVTAMEELCPKRYRFKHKHALMRKGVTVGDHGSHVEVQVLAAVGDRCKGETAWHIEAQHGSRSCYGEDFLFARLDYETRQNYPLPVQQKAQLGRRSLSASPSPAREGSSPQVRFDEAMRLVSKAALGATVLFLRGGKVGRRPACMSQREERLVLDLRFHETLLLLQVMD